VVRRPAIGYSQGMNSIALFLLAFMDEEKAFWTFTYIITSLRTPDFYSGVPFNMSGLRVAVSCVQSLAEKRKSISKKTDGKLADEGMTSAQLIKMMSFPVLAVLFVDYAPLLPLILYWDAFLRGRMGDDASILMALAAIENGEEATSGNDGDDDESGGSLTRRFTSKGYHVDLERTNAVFQNLKQHQQDQHHAEKESKSKTGKNVKDWPSREDIKTQLCASQQACAREMASEGHHLYAVIKATSISPGDIKRYQISFREMTKGSCDNTINEEQFITLVTAAAKESKNSSSSSKDSAGDEEAPSGKGISAELARALFSVADKDKNGGVDFRELMVSLSLLSKGPESTKERLHHLIHAFDYNGDGVLATREIRELATVLVRHRLRAKTGRKKDDDGNESPTPSQEVENMYNELLELDADSNTKMTPSATV